MPVELFTKHSFARVQAGDLLTAICLKCGRPHAYTLNVLRITEEEVRQLYTSCAIGVDDNSAKKELMLSQESPRNPIRWDDAEGCMIDSRGQRLISGDTNWQVEKWAGTDYLGKPQVIPHPRDLETTLDREAVNARILEIGKTGGEGASQRMLSIFYNHDLRATERIGLILKELGIEATLENAAIISLAAQALSQSLGHMSSARIILMSEADMPTDKPRL